MFTSSRRELAKLIFTWPAMLAGIMAVVFVLSPARQGAAFWPAVLLACAAHAALLALIYLGRYLQIEVAGGILSVERPYSLSGRRDSLDLARVRQARLYSYRQDTQLSFCEKPGEKPLLQVSSVPLGAADTLAFGELLRGFGIEANF